MRTRHDTLWTRQYQRNLPEPDSDTGTTWDFWLHVSLLQIRQSLDRLSTCSRNESTPRQTCSRNESTCEEKKDCFLPVCMLLCVEIDPLSCFSFFAVCCVLVCAVSIVDENISPCVLWTITSSSSFSLYPLFLSLSLSYSTAEVEPSTTTKHTRHPVDLNCGKEQLGQRDCSFEVSCSGFVLKERSSSFLSQCCCCLCCAVDWNSLCKLIVVLLLLHMPCSRSSFHHSTFDFFFFFFVDKNSIRLHSPCSTIPSTITLEVIQSPPPDLLPSATT